MLWTLITFVGFTVLVAVISAIATKDDKQDSADGYFLAGRGLPGFVIAGSLLLTNLSAEQLVGTNGQTWAVGMSPMAFEIVAAPCCIVLALFAAPRYLKSGITTIPQLIGLRYDRSTKLWFSIAYIILYLFVQLPVILYSGSLVFENIFHVSDIFGITTFQSVILLCIAISIVGSLYAIVGGLKAVAVSDTVNGVGLLIGGFMIPFLALSKLGNLAMGTESGIHIVKGWSYLVENYSDMLNSIAPLNSEAPAVPWLTVFTGLIFLGLQSWCTHQSFIQRVLAAKNLKEAQKGALYCAFLKIIGFMYLALPGVIAFAIFEIQGNQVEMMDAAYPQLVTGAGDGLLRGRHVRCDPVLVQLGTQLGQHHVHDGHLQGVHQSERIGGTVRFRRQEGRLDLRRTHHLCRPAGILLPGRSEDLPGLSGYADRTAGSDRGIRRILLQVPAEVLRKADHGNPCRMLRRIPADRPAVSGRRHDPLPVRSPRPAPAGAAHHGVPECAQQEGESGTRAVVAGGRPCSRPDSVEVPQGLLGYHYHRVPDCLCRVLAARLRHMGIHPAVLMTG